MDHTDNMEIGELHAHGDDPVVPVDVVAELATEGGAVRGPISDDDSAERVLDGAFEWTEGSFTTIVESPFYEQMRRKTLLTFPPRPFQACAMSRASVDNQIPLVVRRTAVAWLPRFAYVKRATQRVRTWPPSERSKPTATQKVLTFASDCGDGFGERQRWLGGASCLFSSWLGLLMVLWVFWSREAE